MKKLISRQALIASVITALVVVLAMAGISTAASSNDEASASAKRAFTKAQTKALNKAIAKALKKKVGPAGATGAAGAAGPAVAPAAYSATNASDVTIVSNVATYVPIVTKSLPAGKYVVNALVSGFYTTDTGDEDVQMTCRLISGATTIRQTQDNKEANIFLLLLAGARPHVPFVETLDLAATTTVSVECSGGYDNPGTGTGLDVNAGDGHLTAIAVGSIG